MAAGPLRTFAASWRRPAGLALAVVAALYVVGTFTIAQMDARAQTRTLRSMIAAAPPTQRTIVTALDPFTYTFDDTAPLSQAYAQLAKTFPLAPEADSWGEAMTPSATVSGAAPSAMTVLPPEIELSYRTTFRKHARLIAGTWPDKVRPVDDSGFPKSADIAVTQAMAERFGVHVGSHLTANGVTLTISGIVQPTDPSAVFWQAQPQYTSPELETSNFEAAHWVGGAFIGLDEISAFQVAFPIVDVQLSWTVPLDVGHLTAAGAAPLAANLAHLSQRSMPQFTSVSSDFGATLSTYLDAAAVMNGETAMPAISLAAITAVMLFMIAMMAAERRTGEFEVLYARGAGVRRIVRLAAADVLATAVPLVGAVTALALRLLGEPPAAVWLRAAVIVGIALVVPPVAVVVRLRRRAGRTPAVLWIVQGAVVLLCLGGLYAARTQGITTNGGVDDYAAAAPVLAALIAALVVLDLGPGVLSGLLRLALHRRGAIGLIGIARTARAPMSAGITVLSLCIAMTSAGMALAVRRAIGAAAHTVLWHATVTSITTLAVASTVAACVAVAVAVIGDITARRAFLGRLATMGLTDRQGAAITLAELGAPIVAAVVAAAVVAVPLTWAVSPALNRTARGMHLVVTGGSLGLPILATVVLALLAGLGAAVLAQGGTTRALRIGDAEEGR